ncbi:iron-containing redox enzyme family protein [Dyella jejuensis]|uniref:Iron-containing redox enzyme family protein n=1 Tax=Dyella jejuensis TaxID=1432009 RepID=A0ABW8JMA8_9GAMM
MLEKSAFRAKLEETLHHHISKKHPLFPILMNGEKPDIELLRKVAIEGYQITKYFLDYIEHLFFYCPKDLPRHKRRLLFNLFEEETGRLSKSANHVELMERFLKALGVSDAERDAATPLPTTSALIDYRLAAVKDPARYHIGAAAVMIASEGQNLESTAIEARHSILGKVYGLAEKDLLFFSVHAKEDIAHVQQGLDMVADLCVDQQMQEEALFAVDHTSNLFYQMYEGMYQAFCINRPLVAC